MNSKIVSVNCFFFCSVDGGTYTKNVVLCFILWMPVLVNESKISEINSSFEYDIMAFARIVYCSSFTTIDM